MIGVNLACGEFGKTPGTFNKNYTYPGPKQFGYLQRKGITVARLPFKWERLQRELMSPLDAEELRRLDDVVEHARASGVSLLLDLHNYARYDGKLIGTTDVPNRAFADFWRRLASHYKDETAVCAYGIMNEPHDTNGLWPAAAQAAVDAIRSVDTVHTIAACGDGWSGGHSWKRVNAGFLLNDPTGRLVYEAHQYFDHDSSGTYKLGYDANGAHPAIGAERLRPFAEWLKEHDARGFIGEFGVPDDDARWLVVLDGFIAAMKENGIGRTYWAAGPWWGKYPLSVEPRDGKDRPQMAVIEWHLASARSKPERPWFAAAVASEKRAREARESSKVTTPRGTRTIHHLGERKESYHYTNEGSEYASAPVTEDGRKARKVAYRHRGKIAWIGVGLYFGALDCRGYSALSLGIRAEKPCRLEVKAYRTDKERYSGTFNVGTRWQELAIPFEKLLRDGKTFADAEKLSKLELQPSPEHGGSSILLGELRLVP
jgi:endoglucanase